MSQPAKQVVLFNGEPVIYVRRRKDGLYQWATKNSGIMTHSKKSEVRNYMRRHGYKCIFEDGEKDS